jgi:hypothetical protein
MLDPDPYQMTTDPQPWSWELLYLLKVLRHEDEVDAAEAELGDDQEHVDEQLRPGCHCLQTGTINQLTQLQKGANQPLNPTSKGAQSNQLTQLAKGAYQSVVPTTKGANQLVNPTTKGANQSGNPTT